MSTFIYDYNDAINRIDEIVEDVRNGHIIGIAGGRVNTSKALSSINNFCDKNDIEDVYSATSIEFEENYVGIVFDMSKHHTLDEVEQSIIKKHGGKLVKYK